ncbi:MAG: hypothetical protein K2N71_00780, partial [Oscillospiraceae bacterium]|nr:hypothetical protein [Oscillospiraceae bacterium]
MNKDVFKKAFEDVKPSEELVNSVLDIPNVSAVPKKTKRQSFYHKPQPRLSGIIAACVVFVIGVTAAAAEFIDFETVFGNRITVKDSELASSLVGTVSKFKYKVSNKDYKIEIKGVTGDDRSVLVAAEIIRTDGEPIIDHFVNPIQPDEKQLLTLSQETEILTEFTYSYSMDYGVNKAGNIELFINLGSPDSIDGKKMSFKGENFYPAGDYIAFERNKKTNEDTFTEYTQYVESGETKSGNDAPADINDILALDLKWEFSFTYKASDKSHEVKSLNAPEDSFLLNMNVHKLKSEEEFVLKLTAQPTYMEAGSTVFRVDFEYEATGYLGNLDYHTNIFENNEVYIIMSDGERVKAYF